MRKRKKGRKLHREKNQRRALLKSLATALILRERIRTTEIKAKEVRSLVEKSITLAKRKDLAVRHRLLRIFPKNLVRKIIEDIAPRYEKRSGGYTRIVKLGQRESDGAKMAIIELVK